MQLIIDVKDTTPKSTELPADFYGWTDLDSFEEVLADVRDFYMSMDTSTLSSGNRESGVDNIALVPVPELHTLTLAACGLVTIAALRRRNRLRSSSTR